MQKKRLQNNSQLGFSYFFLFCLILGVVTLFIFFIRIYPQFLPSARESSLLEKPRTITLLLAGDVMLGRSVEQESRKRADFAYPFRKTADTLRDADISFVNLENPIIDSCRPHTTGFVFCANTEMIEGLTFSGIDVVTLANNHTRNYGKDGIEQTKKHLTESGILYTGVGEVAVIEKQGMKIGFIGIDKAQQGKPTLTSEEKRLIEESDQKVDVLVVAPHWGVEYRNEPLGEVRLLAQELIRLGADVIVGSHPHWVQSIEYMNANGFLSSTFNNEYSVPVYYSLGNFIFDQMWSEETKKGMAVRLTFENGKLTKEEQLPTYMFKTGQPEFIQ